MSDQFLGLQVPDIPLGTCTPGRFPKATLLTRAIFLDYGWRERLFSGACSGVMKYALLVAADQSIRECLFAPELSSFGVVLG